MRWSSSTAAAFCATAGRARRASDCRATASRAASKTARCSSAAAATSATCEARSCRRRPPQHRPELAGAPFEALGVSLVMHPRNPYVPTVHMNVRLLAALPGRPRAGAWFGGGMDLTPYYGFEDDARHFHRSLPRRAGAVRRRPAPALQALVRRVLLPEAPQRAARHRRHLLRRLRRARLRTRLRDAARGGRCFLAAYLPIVQRRRDTPYGEREREFQALPARTLRRVQPRLRPRHAVRPAVGRAHREHPDVDAAAGATGATTGSPSRARRRRASTPISCGRATGLLTRSRRAPAAVGLFGGSVRSAATRAFGAGALCTRCAAARRGALDSHRPAVAEDAAPSATARHREAMVELAIAGERGFVLRALRARARGTELFARHRASSCSSANPAPAGSC